MPDYVTPLACSQTFRVEVGGGQEERYFVKMLPYNTIMQNMARINRAHQVRPLHFLFPCKWFLY